MAVTTLTPTLRVSPRVAKWTLSEVGADDAFEVGHNNSVITFYAFCTTGSVTLKLQASPDGTTWIDVPDTTVTLDANQGTVLNLNLSAHSVRPAVTSASSPMSATVYVIAVRP